MSSTCSWPRIHTGKEEELKKWYSENLNVECTAFPEAGRFIVLNNSRTEQDAVIWNDKGKTVKMELKPFESRWVDMDIFK